MTLSNFRGEYRWLSNFEASAVILDGVEYPTVEHAYQAAKTLDLRQRAEIHDCDTPGKARKLGQKVTFRPGWELMKISAMYTLVLQKFVKHSHLKEKLLATEDHHLIEDTTQWDDRFWGVSEGRGKNHLGRILMDVREELRESIGSSSLGAIYNEMGKYMDKMERIEKIEDGLRKSERRRMEQATEIMALQADNSTLQTKVATMKGHVEQCFRDGQGHNHCWRNVERLFEQFGLKSKRLGLPPLDEFRQGCEAFQRELYSNPERWSDFIPMDRLTEGERKEDLSTLADGSYGVK